MHVHSTLDGRAGEFRMRGAVWEVDGQTYRGFLYLVPTRTSDRGRHRVVAAEAQSVWELLDALSAEASMEAGAPVRTLNARLVGEDVAPRAAESGSGRQPLPM